jgi:thiol:disulfide interchange protein
MEPAAVVPTLSLLVGIGVACWIAARTSLTAERADSLKRWALVGVVVLFAAVFSFGWLYSNEQPVAWEPFTLEKLQQVAVDEGRTVLVDFSAEWCITCKALEKAVLHTKPVEQAIAAVGAVKMYADFTHQPPEIQNTLHALRSSGVPVIAIFPGDRPYEPIVFRGGYTQNGLIEALETATGRSLRPEGGAVADAATAAVPLN